MLSRNTVTSTCEVVEKPYRFSSRANSRSREARPSFSFDRRRSPMAVTNLESLVLNGSAVLSVGKAGNPRLGTSDTAKTPEIRISMRHPSRSCGQEFQPAPRPNHVDYLRVDALAVYGAGRSLCCAGVLSRRSVADNSALSANVGGNVSATAVRLGSAKGRLAAFVSEVTSGRLTTPNATILPTSGVTPAVITVVMRCPAGLSWCKPANRTPPTSTWGFGVR
jgi:hypothetical protein